MDKIINRLSPWLDNPWLSARLLLSLFAGAAGQLDLTALRLCLESGGAYLSERLGALLVEALGDRMTDRLRLLCSETHAPLSEPIGAGDLLDIDWRLVSPTLFGAIHEARLSGEKRRAEGVHYTSDADCLLVLDPLVFDDLRSGLNECQTEVEFAAYAEKLSRLTFLDPACGCGNFLVAAYRELKRLETLALSRCGSNQARVSIGQMHGIELDKDSCVIADAALLAASLLDGTSGQSQILCANALTVPWPTTDYVVGNPPFVCRGNRTAEQKAMHNAVMAPVSWGERLDYASCWFVRAAELPPATRCAFLVTNSVVQGEHVSILWSYLLAKGVQIHWARKSFEWSDGDSDARVHCVVVGFGKGGVVSKWLYDGRKKIEVKEISPYLTEGCGRAIGPSHKSSPESGLMSAGCYIADDGHYVFTAQEKEEFLRIEPAAAPLFRRWVGGRDILHNEERWVLFVFDQHISDLAAMPLVMDRIARVGEFRRACRRADTRRANALDTVRFWLPSGKSILVPDTSSSRRKYLPCGVFEGVVPNCKAYPVEFSPYRFGVMSSAMYMTWVKAVGGRMKSDIRFGTNVHYSFPWPSPTDSQRARVAAASDGVLRARDAHPGKTLAELYDPNAMPEDLAAAHAALDGVVDELLGGPGLQADARTACLFGRYACTRSPAVP